MDDFNWGQIDHETEVAEASSARIAKLEKVIKEIASSDLSADEFNSYYNYRAIVSKAREVLDH